MVRVERGNVVLKVEKEDVQHYLSLGYSVSDENGNILQTATPSNVSDLKAAYVQNRKTIEDLEHTVAELTAENTKLKAQLKAKSKKSETEKKANVE